MLPPPCPLMSFVRSGAMVGWYGCKGETAVGKEDATLIRVVLCRVLGALYCIGYVSNCCRLYFYFSSASFLSLPCRLDFTFNIVLTLY